MRAGTAPSGFDAAGRAAALLRTQEAVYSKPSYSFSSPARTPSGSSSGGAGIFDMLASIFSAPKDPQAFSRGYAQGAAQYNAAYNAPAMVPRGFSEAAAAQDASLQQRMSIISSMSSGMRSFNPPDVVLPQMQIDYGSDDGSAGRSGNGALVLAVVLGIGVVVYKNFRGRKK